MIGRIRRLLERLFGTESETTASSERPDREPGDSTAADERVSGTGEPILDEVYGQPGQSRALDRIDNRAREIADERGIDLEDDQH